MAMSPYGVALTFAATCLEARLREVHVRKHNACGGYLDQSVCYKRGLPFMLKCYE